MQVSVLGPVEVIRDGSLVAVGGARVRALLTRLAVAGGRPVTSADLIGSVWGHADSDDPANALQSLVSRLRRALGAPGAVVQVPGGYRLDVRPADVDVHRFEALVAAGRADLREGRFDDAEAKLAEALTLWRGPALADLPDALDASALEEARTATMEDRLEAEIRRGRAGEAATQLESLVAATPLRERTTALLMDALVADGRGAEALAAYERTRLVLADELGADPGTALTDRHLRILRAVPTEPAEPAPPQRTNLRTALTSFVGREADLSTVAERLHANRLVTLVGPGGAGKTRLAAELGRSSIDRFRDGVWMIELAAVTDPGDVIGAAIGALGVREAALFDPRAAMTRAAINGQRSPLARLSDALTERELLLILDNCEHVLDAVAELADHLLTRCPSLRILTTSRESLAVPGESLFPVPPLGHESDGAAVRLFLDRAQAIRPSVINDLAAIDEICRRLDGLPLAIELAAARTRGLTVRQIADRLNDRFRLLSGGNRVAVARHRTLRAVVEWSWDLLTDDERWLLEHLSVFAGGVSVDSADAVWSAAGRRGDTVDLLATLVDKSLMQLAGGSQPRYRLLETIREFGTDRLADRGELAAALAQHASHFRDWAVRVEPLVRTSEQLVWIDRLADERDNLFAAIQHLVDIGEGDGAVELAGALAWFWTVRGEHGVAATWLGHALDVPGGHPSYERALASGLRTLNSGVWTGGGNNLSIDTDALSGHDDPDVHPLAVVMRAVGMIFAPTDQDTDAYLTGMLARTAGWPQATLHMMRSLLAENNGDVALMRESLGAALPAFRQLGERFGLSSCLELQARIAVLDGDLDQAIDALGQAARTTRELGAFDDAGQAMCWRAGVHLRRDDRALARADLDAAELDFAHTSSGFSTVVVDSVRARLDLAEGDIEAARSRISRARSHLNESTIMPPQAMAMIVSTAAEIELSSGYTPLGAQLVAEAIDTAITSLDLPVIALAAVLAAQLNCHRGDGPRGAELLGVGDRLRGSPDPTNPTVTQLERDLRTSLGDNEFARLHACGYALPRADAFARLLDSARA